MEIKVLGTGCLSCKTLYETTQQAIAELGIITCHEKVIPCIYCRNYFNFLRKWSQRENRNSKQRNYAE